MTVELSVLIVTYNSGAHIDHCLESLSRALEGVDAEVLVHDNNSTDDTLTRVMQHPGVDAVASTTNDGFAAACNSLAQRSRGRFLLFLNPDTRTDETAARELLQAAAQQPEAALYGARTVTPDGRTVAGSAQQTMTLRSLVCFATGMSTLFPGRRWTDPESIPGWDRSTSRHVPMLSGGALMISRAAWTRLGGFDPRYFMYGEDADLSTRARDAGFSPLFVAPAVVQHDVGGSSAAGTKLVLLHRGKVTYLRKLWSPLPAAIGVRLLLGGVALRSGAASLGLFPTRPGRSSGSAWQEAWARRSEWRDGWGDPPGPTPRPPSLDVS